MNIQGFSPMMAAPLHAESANAAPPTGSTGSSSGTSSSDLQSTFLNLLVTELQNQDPTSPVDPTAMVSQMVSLNQLDQLISINQTLSDLSTTPTPSSTVSTSPAAAAALKAQNLPTANGTAASAFAPHTAALSQIPIEGTNFPNTQGLMNLYGSFAAPVAKMIPNQLGAR